MQNVEDRSATVGALPAVEYLSLALQVAIQLKQDVMIPVDTARTLAFLLCNKPSPDPKASNIDWSDVVPRFPDGTILNYDHLCALLRPSSFPCPLCNTKLDHQHEAHDCISPHENSPPPVPYDTGCELAIPASQITSVSYAEEQRRTRPLRQAVVAPATMRDAGRGWHHGM